MGEALAPTADGDPKAMLAHHKRELKIAKSLGSHLAKFHQERIKHYSAKLRAEKGQT